MTPGPPSLEDLVRAICQGKAIDWESLERDASPGFHNKLVALRVVESIARVHKTVRPEGEAPSADASSADQTAAPDCWGHLELQEHVASGAFGDVYRAWDSGLDREVALKLLRRSPDADAHADEALEEGRLLAKVRHPNVVTVHGAARFDGRAGVWMEFVRGLGTLADLAAQDGPLPPAKAASIGVALCHALSAVHGASLVHRDVKPQNVMVSDDGRIVLMDFGAGGSVRHAGLQHAGTPHYLAPEVAAGGPATVQSDIYSLGVTLRYLLTGSFEDRSEFVPKGRDDRHLLALLDRATNARPQERYETAEDFAGVLAKFIQPHRNVAAIAVAVILVVALLVVSRSTLRTPNLEESTQRALEESWQTATPNRAPLTPDQSQRLSPALHGTFSFHGNLPGTTTLHELHEAQQSVVTFDPRSGDTRVWLTYSTTDGNAGPSLVSPDDSLVAYVWDDHSCECVSLRSVDRSGQIRTLVSGPEIVGIVSGASASRLLPILIGHKAKGFELAVVDIDSGAKRMLRMLPVEPIGFSLSSDGRFVAFDVPRGSEPGSSRDIVIHEVSSSREWPLLDTAGDRVLPVWSPRGEQLFYLDSSPDAMTLRAVRVLNGHRDSQPALLRRDIGKPTSIGFVDDETFAYSVGTGRSDVMVVEAAPNGSFRDQKPRRISQGSMMPAWSPDTRWLAWTDFAVRSGGIRVTGADGHVFRSFRPSLNVQVMPTWSEDSTQLAFFDVSDNEFILRVASLESATTRDIMRSPSSGFYTLAWMSGGRELLLNSDGKHIVAVDIATGSQREIHAAPPTDDIGPLYVSPDGHSLLFCEGHEEPAPIHIIPLNPRGLSLVRPASKADAEALVGWWPDGSLFETRASSHPEGPPEDELWRLPLDGAPPEPLGITGTGIFYASVTRDRKRIAYSTQTFGQELWTLKPVRPQ